MQSGYQVTLLFSISPEQTTFQKGYFKRSEILPIDKAPSPGDTHPKVLIEMETEIGKPVGDILTSSAE